MLLATQVGVVPADIVLHGAQLLSLKSGTRPQIFGPGLLWPNGRPS